MLPALTMLSGVGRRAVAAVGAAAVALSLAASPGPALAEQPRNGGTLRIGLEADFVGFDPLNMGTLVDRTVSAAFYETLIEIDESGELVPLLAESWFPSDDGKVYTVKLRQGIKFHDGTPFNAEAVAANFKRLMDPANACRCAADVATVDRVVVADPYTVEFHLKKPNASFPAVLADVSGMQPSPTAVEKAGKNYPSQPVGTGPFRFVEWNRGVTFRVERNPDYWQKGLPHLDAVVYRPIPDQQTRMASLQAGDIDVSVVPSAQDVARVKAGSLRRIKLVEAPGLGTVFNMFNAQREPLNDRRVRQALFHATDRKTINAALNRGVYQTASSPFGTGMLGGKLTADFPEYDQDKARALLKEYGKPVSFTLSVSATPDSVRVAQVLAQMWKKVGVDAKIQQYEQRQLIQHAIKSNFDSMFFRWPGRADPDLNSYQFFHSSSTRNYTRYSNPKMDALVEQGRTTQDPKKRADVYRQVAQLLADDGPYLFLWSTSTFFLTGEHVKGLPAVPDGLPRVRNVWLSR